MSPHKYTKIDFDQFLDDLGNACQWLSICRGRAKDYVKLLEESHQHRVISEEHIHSFFECYPLVDIYRSWKDCVDEFPGLKHHIKQIFEKGPILTKNEKPTSSSNKSRNDAFAVLLAGRFISAGIDVTQVDGYPRLEEHIIFKPDFTFRCENKVINVECKRIQSQKGLIKRAKQAKSQIKKSNKYGLIAIDCSRLPRDDIQDSLPHVNLLDDIFARLKEIAEDNEFVNLYSKKVLGIILYRMIPVCTSYTNTTSYNRDCYSGYAFNAYRDSRLAKRMLKRITTLLEQHSVTHMT